MTWPTAERQTLDCQACGNVVKVLTPAEVQMVAANPYNFIVYCRDAICQEAARADARREGLL
jgi:hypothetical protein